MRSNSFAIRGVCNCWDICEDGAFRRDGVMMVSGTAVVTAGSLVQETVEMAFNVIFGLALVALFGISESRNVFAALREQPATS